MKLYSLDVILVAAGMPMSGHTIPDGKSLGGSETAAVQIAETMAKKGHHVTLVCNTDKPDKVNGVLYMPIGWVQDRPDRSPFPKGFFDLARSTPHDLLIVQRLPMLFSYEFQSKANFLWQHDLATKQGPSNFHGVLWNIDRILLPSEFMRKQYQSVHGGSDKIYHVTRNGIDLNLIDSTADANIERDRFRLTFTSRPERGLDVLLRDVFPEILKREPRAKLHISRYEDPATLPLYQELSELAKRYGDSIVNMGNLGKQALYENYRKSRLVLYPSTFEEISMLTANEAGACGSVLIGPWKAALPETCDGNHVLIRQNGQIGRKGDPVDRGFEPLTKEFIQTFADKVVELIHGGEEWGKLSKGARQRAENWTWDSVADDWIGLAHELIKARTSESRRLAKHFIVNSDVVAARKLAEKVSDPWVKETVDKYVQDFVPFMNREQDQKQAIADFYEQRSGGDRCDWQTAFWADQEPRLRILIDFIVRHRSEIKTVLDFGCAHGGYARAISNAFPDIKVVGTDVSPSLIRAANELKAGTFPDGRPACEHPGNLAFLVGDEDTNWIVPDGGGEGLITYEEVEARKFDLVVAMEVLEHLPNSEEVAKKLERHCKSNGFMAFTVPTGHRERDELITKGVPPVHVRSFDLHDLRDMFGKKNDFHVTAFSDFQELPLDRTFAGWFMATYRKDENPIGEIDWERKLFLQNPRETLAVCMIVHNADQTLRRCLKSLQPIADQIVIVDNGPSVDRTVETALEFTQDVRTGTSPFYCYAHMIIHPQDQITPGTCDMAGFETPRNESIEGVWADHILWQDADENLLDPGNVFKYLRPNAYLGYGINQHHVSIQPPGTMKVDVPVRIFRNKSGMRCIGKVHEHFELGVNQGIGPDFIVLQDINVHHDGYLTEDIRRARFRRNIKLLECDRLKYPDRLLGIYLYDVRDNIHMAYYDMERNGGQLTPKAAQHAHAVIDAYRQHFLGKPLVFADEGLSYYGQALQILGMGIEVAVSMDVKKSGATANGVKKFRVMNAQEAKMILGMTVDQQAGVYEGPYAS